ncbi:hypothetical protein EMIHUDRAFT_224594 [Emiliania huxleyi CCMP1516]|uniref:VOC domain-containing protein n=2 Tax=Emiliania huxleyi TaxID=2903 RepID=A0A0D3JZJ6_EMIH1|nr:hypothetical protein EMIHUDRAFT_254018 [Emiliania huxleyi CCMP1516]XP_005790921.1 hypothetical protein EMIHUDRAFT_224594 [Emiliania huxleyi CCMP1516]EOD28931.1 hypothetical protein EMIHUDRAFT_254018 [Emiliania huxleyi CCMP1516]EOD38492.1 hypothetical protein EMIHUDRAFT_224594 [Emiliania huxleyi CCMP1516]|eukprot:XP_005781360.1 hypothetical protein EMIHUDRAFT_254018 [Emiliania huxleyi CCMP1516]
MMALLCPSATALVLLGGQRHGATATPRATPPRLAALERVAVSVGDAASAAAFYEATLGLVATADATTDDGRPRHLLGGGGSLQLELREGGADGAAAGYSAEGGYRGLVARVGNVAAAVAAARENGGTVLSESATVEHGPSSKPEEGVDVVTAVTQATVADPAGYPLLLFEAGEGEGGVLCAARCDVTAWKASEDWWQRRGLETLRWQANLPNEASISRDTIASPRPPLRLGDEAVLQLRYVYSAADVQQAGGLEALVVSSPGCGEEGVEEGKEPDGYPVVFRE